MSKPTVNTFGVTNAVFNLWSETNTWLAQYGVNQRMLVDPNNSQQLLIELGSSMSEMQDCNIDVYDMPQLEGAWSDWQDEYTIVIGPLSIDEQINEDDHDHFGAAHIAPIRPLPPINLDFDATPMIDNTPVHNVNDPSDPLAKFARNLFNNLKQAA